MIIGTNLRRGLLLAYKKRPVVRIGTACGGGGGDGAAIDGGSLNALGSDGKLKTHPLGIGTCASEYM